MLIIGMAIVYIADLILKAIAFSIAVLVFPKIFKRKIAKIVGVMAFFILGDFINWVVASELQLSITTKNEEVAKFFGGNDLTSAFLQGPTSTDFLIYLAVVFLASFLVDKWIISKESFKS